MVKRFFARYGAALLLGAGGIVLTTQAPKFISAEGAQKAPPVEEEELVADPGPMEPEWSSPAPPEDPNYVDPGYVNQGSLEGVIFPKEQLAADPLPMGTTSLDEALFLLELEKVSVELSRINVARANAALSKASFPDPHSSTAASANPGTSPPLSSISPTSFGPPQLFVKGVQLGMTLEELDKARPGLERFTFAMLRPGEEKIIDTKNPNQALSETLKNPFFTNAMYHINQGRLDSLALVSAPFRNTFAAKRDAFLAQAVRSYGEPTHFLVQLDGPRPGPAIVWERGDKTISASFSQWNAPRKIDAWFCFKMQTREFANYLKRFVVPVSLAQREQEAMLAPVKASVARLLRGGQASLSGR